MISRKFDLYQTPAKMYENRIVLQIRNKSHGRSNRKNDNLSYLHFCITYCKLFIINLSWPITRGTLLDNAVAFTKIQEFFLRILQGHHQLSGKSDKNKSF